MDRNEGFCYQERLGPVEPETTVLAYLVRRYPHSDTEEWRGRIKAGLVRVDHGPVDTSSELREGQLLSWHRPPWEEEAAPLSYAVLYEDRDVLAVAKPAGLPTVPGGGFLNHTLWSRVRLRDPEASPVHRLGRWTSGVVLFGRTPRARAGLTKAWRERGVLKVYRALAAGVPDRSDFAVDVPIGPVPYPPLGTLHAASSQGRPASSRFRVLERRDRSFLAEAIIDTGRPHQIRIHLAAAGHPLVGDPLYTDGGRPHEGGRALPGDPGYHLHAHRLELSHPIHGGPLVIECPPPPRLRGQRPRDSRIPGP